ncbi:MAG: hypothetical protein KJO46_04180 [Gammaproteobacteria bacterium]|nr:hypothetical protein [Gammaproteobacteria bacterium]
MTKAPSRQTRNHGIASRTQKTLLPLFAVGGSLAAAPASALELGDVVVQSRLGQPLRASIAFALAPNEKLDGSCVAVSQGPSPSGLPGVGRATITIVDGTLLLQGSTPIREPMVAANVMVKCPSTANLSREYMMFIDPAGIEIEAPVAARSSAVVAAAAAEEVVAAPVRQTPRTAPPRRSVTSARNRTPVGQATRYQVQPGDSLSEITQRIENRTMALWPAVNVIFEANPDAFIDNDPNKLKAGSWLTIPSFDGSQPVVATMRSEVADLAPVETASADAVVPAELVAPDLVAQPEPVESVVNEAPDVAADFTADLRPVEDTAAVDNTLVSTAANETVAIPDVELEGPRVISASPNVTTAAISAATPEEPSSSWMLWLAGLGIGVILALLFFGRSLRNRFAGDPVSDNAELPIPEKAPVREPEPAAIEVVERVNWNLQDDAPTVENKVLDLDADLEMGTGLGDATENSQIREIGFPAPTEVDIELPLEEELSVDQDETEAAASSTSGEFDITLESEKLPVDENDEFDISVSVDATKMADTDDEDQSELQSIEVEAIDENLLLNDNTVDPSIAFDILEQDYEDELSATQAVNADVARAALEMTAVLGRTSDDTQSLPIDDDQTASMSLASVMDLSEEDDNGFAANDDASSEIALDEATVEMPLVDDDKTEIMSRKRRKVDSKAG